MAETEEPMEVDSSFFDDRGQDEVDEVLRSFQNEKNPFSNETSRVPESRYENKAGTFTTGIDIFSKEEQKKLEERAQRFGIKNTNKKSQLSAEEDLYSSMGIIEDSENFKHIRLNVLHMRGTEEMSTKDVFDYFKEYPPASIEWINDVSCNVVWLDKITAARALLGLSKKIIKPDNQASDEENKPSDEEQFSDAQNSPSKKHNTENTIHIRSINFPIPPGIWRKGNDCPKSKTILLRFSTSSDKKQPNAEKLSEYYKKYGNPNFGGMKGILTDRRKKVYKEIRSTKRRLSDADGNSNDRKRVKNPWGSLSENWGAYDSVEDDFRRKISPREEEKSSIKGRLGFKAQQKEKIVIEDTESELSSESDEDWNKRSKTLRMRMHADDEEEKVQKKKLKQLTKKIQETISTNDLRSRLGRSRVSAPIYRDEIQVIVTNEPERYRSSKRLEEEVEEEAVEEDVEELEEEIVEEHEEKEDLVIQEESEKEEGEWVEDDENAPTVEEPEDEEEVEQEEDSDSSDISEKEIQGPKGSVIKVVPRAKPRVASTVWARLNHNEEKHLSSSDRRNMRSTLKPDLRSRLGYHNRERSPLRIEVKNDQYNQVGNESE